MKFDSLKITISAIALPLVISCNSKHNTSVETDTTIADTAAARLASPAIAPVVVSRPDFKLKLNREKPTYAPLTYTLHSLMGLDAKKDYKFICREDPFARNGYDVYFINNQMIECRHEVSNDSTDFVITSHRDNETDTIYYERGYRNYLIVHESGRKSPADIVEISRNLIFRAEPEEFNKEKYFGHRYSLGSLELYRVTGDTIDFHIGYYQYDSDFGDLYTYRLTRDKDSLFIDYEYYRIFGNAPFGIEAEE